MVKIIHSIPSNQNPRVKFIVISLFGNDQNLIKNNQGKYTPNVLIRDHKIKTLHELGMVDHLNVFCDDITPEQAEELHQERPGEYLVKLFDENNAKDVIEFIEKYKNEDYVLIVHCDAGISRSSATAIFCGSFVGIGPEYFVGHYPYIRPNQHILKTLRDEQAKNNK